MEHVATTEGARRELAAVAQQAAACFACDLSATRNQTVPGEGNPRAAVVFVGEAPGAREDLLGRPFVGAAGRYLDRLLAVAGLSRDKVFVVNTVKCRPPANRPPRPAERAACAPLLARQLAAINPRVVATLGRHALAVFAPAAEIAESHGYPYAGGVVGLPSDATLFPLYHPAAALHNGALRPILERDMRSLRTHLDLEPRNGTREATLREADSVPDRPRTGKPGEAE